MSRISRRRFLEGTGAGLVGAAALPPAEAKAQPQPSTAPAVGVPRTRITLNGAARALEVEDRWTLAELLRDQLGLTGTKVGCDRGECGACTVLLDGRAVCACSTLACWADGHDVRTVEGLAGAGRLDALQQSFIEGDAPQCGFCTSEHLMSARALLDESPRPTRDDLGKWLAPVRVTFRASEGRVVLLPNR